MRRRLVVALLALPLLLTACGGKSVDATTAEPAAVERVAGTNTYRITLAAKTAERLDVRTAAVERDGSGTVVPYSAMFYSPTGETWVYVNSAPLMFVRHSIVVDHIDGDRVVLSDGPSQGTKVATAGVSELHGIESGAAGS
jgi:hypothetical protein